MREYLLGRVAAVVAAVLMVAVLAPQSGASAASLKTLYSFCQQSGCADGATPIAGLIVDAGQLYGTTIYGGKYGGGTVFHVTLAGQEKVLYNFCEKANCVDGKYPGAFGTTQYGGAHNMGTVFEVTAGGQETVLYSFCEKDNCADGAVPFYSGLITDASGNLYGTTKVGGRNGVGTVFELTPAGRETVLYNFCSQGGCADGATPTAGLITDASGKLYGTTQSGGYDGGGTVFELTPNAAKTKWTEKVLHLFVGGADGAYPYAGLVMDASGKLYGTTQAGGANKNGTVFELTPNAAKTKWTEKVLYSFCAEANCADGSTGPANAVLIMDASGNLYGTTLYGGENKQRHGVRADPQRGQDKMDRESPLHLLLAGHGGGALHRRRQPLRRPGHGRVGDALRHDLKRRSWRRHGVRACAVDAD